MSPLTSAWYACFPLVAALLSFLLVLVYLRDRDLRDRAEMSSVFDGTIVITAPPAEDERRSDTDSRNHALNRNASPRLRSSPPISARSTAPLL